MMRDYVKEKVLARGKSGKISGDSIPYSSSHPARRAVGHFPLRCLKNRSRGGVTGYFEITLAIW